VWGKMFLYEDSFGAVLGHREEWVLLSDLCFLDGRCLLYPLIIGLELWRYAIRRGRGEDLAVRYRSIEGRIDSAFLNESDCSHLPRCMSHTGYILTYRACTPTPG
jgi:hypothetical protein